MRPFPIPGHPSIDLLSIQHSKPLEGFRPQKWMIAGGWGSFPSQKNSIVPNYRPARKASMLLVVALNDCLVQSPLSRDFNTWHYFGHVFLVVLQSHQQNSSILRTLIFHFLPWKSQGEFVTRYVRHEFIHGYSPPPHDITVCPEYIVLIVTWLQQMFFCNDFGEFKAKKRSCHTICLQIPLWS